MSLITVSSEGYSSLHCFMEFVVSLFEFFGSLVFVSLLLLSFYLWTVFILCFRLSNVCVPLSLRDVRWGQCPACVGWNKDTWWKKGTSQECTGGVTCAVLWVSIRGSCVTPSVRLCFSSQPSVSLTHCLPGFYTEELVYCPWNYTHTHRVYYRYINI